MAHKQSTSLMVFLLLWPMLACTHSTSHAPLAPTALTEPDPLVVKGPSYGQKSPSCRESQVRLAPYSAAIRFRGRAFACLIGLSPYAQFQAAMGRQTAIKSCMHYYGIKQLRVLISFAGDGQVHSIRLTNHSPEPGIEQCMRFLRRIRLRGVGCHWSSTYFWAMR